MKTCPNCKNSFPKTDYPGKKKKSGWCKKCCAQRSKEYYAKNKEKCKAMHKKWAIENKEKVAFHKAKSAYGISLIEYNSLKRICVICGNLNNLKIDHSHQSGRIRGMLCDSCNKGLGFFKDNPALLDRASNYVLGIATSDDFNINEVLSTKLNSVGDFNE